MYRKIGKRLVDLMITTPALLVAAPIGLLVALLVRITLGSPVIFAQPRAGYRGQPFVLYKFRTMRDGVDRSGRPLPDEQRLTPVGHWLRKFSLDELPQLINVLRGDMSLVGPRPLLVDYLSRYSPSQARRHEVKPGITGWAQVQGRNALDWDTKFEMDVWYVDHVGFVTDLKILCRTLDKVLKPSGISAAGHATMPEFQGSRGSEAKPTGS